MGEHAGAGPGQVVRLGIPHPAQLADRGRGNRNEAGRVGPRLGAELADEVGGRLRGTGVVPQQRISHDLAVLVEQHHAVLLAADGHGGHPVEQAPAARLLPRRPPVAGVDLGAVGVRRTPGAHHLPGVGVADDDLAGLGRGVDPGDEQTIRHVVTLSAFGSGGRAGVADRSGVAVGRPGRTAGETPSAGPIQRWAPPTGPVPPVGGPRVADRPGPRSATRVSAARTGSTSSTARCASAAAGTGCRAPHRRCRRAP